MLPLLLSLPAFADALFGVDYVPPGRGDDAWINASQLSGELAGEFDGLLVPPLTAWGGVLDGRNAALFGLGAVRLSSHTIGSTEAIDATTTLRISGDYRYYLRDRRPGAPTPWVHGGLYGVIPVVRDESTALTDEEQAAADEAASEVAARVGGVGARLGVGAELLWDNGLALGARTSAAAHRASSVLEDTRTVSTSVRVEAALTLSFTFASPPE